MLIKKFTAQERKILKLHDELCNGIKQEDSLSGEDATIYNNAKPIFCQVVKNIERNATHVMTKDYFIADTANKFWFCAWLEYVCFRHLMLLEFTSPIHLFTGEQAIEKKLKAILLLNRVNICDHKHGVNNLWNDVKHIRGFREVIPDCDKYDMTVKDYEGAAQSRYLDIETRISEQLLTTTDAFVSALDTYVKQHHKDLYLLSEDLKERYSKDITPYAFHALSDILTPGKYLTNPTFFKPLNNIELFIPNCPNRPSGKSDLSKILGFKISKEQFDKIKIIDQDDFNATFIEDAQQNGIRIITPNSSNNPTSC